MVFPCDLIAAIFWWNRVWRKKTTVFLQKKTIELPLDPRYNFKEPLFKGMCANKHIALHATFCTINREIDTYVGAGLVRPRHKARWWFIAIALLGWTGIYFLIGRPYLRARVRKNLGGIFNAGITDVLGTWFCYFCAVCQEAREVDKALVVQTSLFCILETYGAELAIGRAIRINAANKQSGLSFMKIASQLGGFEKSKPSPELSSEEEEVAPERLPTPPPSEAPTEESLPDNMMSVVLRMCPKVEDALHEVNPLHTLDGIRPPKQMKAYKPVYVPKLTISKKNIVGSAIISDTIAIKGTLFVSGIYRRCPEDVAGRPSYARTYQRNMDGDFGPSKRPRVLYFNDSVARWVISTELHSKNAFARCSDLRVSPDGLSPWEAYVPEEKEFEQADIRIVKCGA